MNKLLKCQMNKLLIGLTLLTSISISAHQLEVKCSNIIPQDIQFEDGVMLTDTFILSEKLGYFDEEETNYGLIQTVKIVDANGETTESLNVASQFYANGECGPAKIVADNKSQDVLENDATTKITIIIDNVCDSKNTSKYTLEREGQTPIIDSFTPCTYNQKD